jgi:hypothetical protein
MEHTAPQTCPSFFIGQRSLDRNRDLHQAAGHGFRDFRSGVTAWLHQAGEPGRASLVSADDKAQQAVGVYRTQDAGLPTEAGRDNGPFDEKTGIIDSAGKASAINYRLPRPRFRSMRPPILGFEVHILGSGQRICPQPHADDFETIIGRPSPHLPRAGVRRTGPELLEPRPAGPQRMAGQAR